MTVEPYVIETCMDILRRRRRPVCANLLKAQEAAAEAANARDSERLAALLHRQAFLAGIATRALRLQWV
jgi:hypothetical protein